jgi:putative transcriptional regulator
MTKKTKQTARDRLNDELLEMAEAYRGTILSEDTADKITMRILSERARSKPALLAPDEIKALRERAHMSQATTGYLSQLERGARRPTGAALAMLHVIRRKGIEAIL